MKVVELMTRDVKTCSPHDFLSTPARIMWENDCGSVPVVDHELKIAGMITDRDVCMAAYTQDAALRQIRVDTAMAPTVVTCGPDDDLEDAQDLMRRNKVHRLPVADAVGKLMGILSLSDLVLEAERQRKAQRGTKKAAELLDLFGALREPRSHTESHLTFGPEEGEAEFRPASPLKRGHLHKPHLHGGR
jgi:CBS domain-containing protein